ncbi:Cbb3-type cytochrome oxidase assembly protein CcoS [Caenorhabditis elegans]|uniref:Cbb3-type cytochrome oxidase assembly protein CcoS n=1 Tax=Caenorhabditis elegans TaxID=6239 RepID=Q4R143_CAEEL|nr:Cbb3-type cytochrome oxidase assembly protein CcoS [Caenorhabditis elegans]CCD61494.1 Cbb3-type cytochrome oxidase assembly protein CcoS [Caenorhabditis elegans]|eukprot:NP_001033465.1 Uncharacterized protein CELE_B0238.15 [Caenorhabditis elegans]
MDNDNTGFYVAVVLLVAAVFAALVWYFSQPCRQDTAHAQQSISDRHQEQGVAWNPLQGARAQVLQRVNQPQEDRQPAADTIF